MSTAPAAVQVITVNYRSAKLTLRMLESLAAERRAYPELGLRAIVVENASGDEELLRREVPRFGELAELVISEKNGGYGAGNNVGLRHAFERGTTARYFHFLNPDTEVRPGGVAELVRFMDARPEVGVAGGLLQNEDGSDWPYAFRFPTPLSELERACELGVVSRMLAGFTVARLMGTQPEQVDWLPGASMMARRDLIERVGGFDEEYFLYYEETDLCLRAREDGWQVWYVPASKVMHIAGASTGVTAHNQGPKRLPKYWFESRRRYFIRNHGYAYAALADLAFLAGNSVGVLKRLLKKQPETPHLFTDFLKNSVLLPQNKSFRAPRPFKPEPAKQGHA